MSKKLVSIMILVNAVAAINERLIDVDREDGWEKEVAYWGKVACLAGRRRVLSLHEIQTTDQCRRLNDFFEDLVTYVEAICGAATSTKSYRNAAHVHGQTYLDYFGEVEYDDSYKTVPTMIERQNESLMTSNDDGTHHLFPHSDVEILVMLMEDSISILMDGDVFEKWDNRRHVIVLMITKKKITADADKLLSDIFVILLQRMWNEKRVLNVFFAAPFSSLGHFIWFYDPFVMNLNTGIRGKVFASRVSKIQTLDRVMNLHGYELKVGMFEEKPSAIKYNLKSSFDFPFARNAKGFVGVDGATMGEIATRMNFAIKLVPPTDGIEFGYVHPNGTYVGTIGDAAYHRIDISFNAMYYKIYTQSGYTTRSIEFTTPIGFDRTCIVVPRAQKIPRWLRTFHYFHPAIWLCLVITLIIVALIWYAVRTIQIVPAGSAKTSYPSLLLSILFIFIGAPVRIKISDSEKFILGAFMLFGITIMGAFTGTLYHCFTNEMYYKEITNLKELNEFGIPIRTASPNLVDIFSLRDMPDDPEEIRSLRKNIKVINFDGTPTVQKTALNRNVASVTRENVFAVTSRTYVDDTGASLIHLVDECPRVYYLAYAMPKNSFYLRRINTLITRLLQAGLPTLWNSVTTDTLINIESVANHSSQSRTERVPFNLRDMQSAFLFLGMGYAIAFCVFVGEISYNIKNNGR